MVLSVRNDCRAVQGILLSECDVEVSESYTGTVPCDGSEVRRMEAKIGWTENVFDGVAGEHRFCIFGDGLRTESSKSKGYFGTTELKLLSIGILFEVCTASSTEWCIPVAYRSFGVMVKLFSSR